MGAQLTWEPPPKEALEGREGWLLEMHVNIEDLLQGQDGKRMQDTRALVFDGASGVGKTFGALKLSEHLPQDPARDLADIVPRDFAIPPRTYDLHSVYIGFNVNAGLTVHEGREELSSWCCAGRPHATYRSRLCLALAEDAEQQRRRAGQTWTPNFGAFLESHPVVLGECVPSHAARYVLDAMQRRTTRRPQARSGSDGLVSSSSSLTRANGWTQQ